MAPRRFFGAPWRTAAGILAVATVVGALATGQQWVVSVSQSSRTSFWRLAAVTMPFWYLWVLLAPVVVWLSHRLPLERDRLFPRIAAHVVTALVLAAVHSTLHLSIVWVVQSMMGVSIRFDSFRSALMSITFFEMSMNFLAYALIVGITRAVELYHQLRAREVVAADLAAQLSRAELDTLRMQLNPHFLFNAMNAISMLVRQEQNREAVRTIAGLSDLLRYVLEESRDQEVPLREELDFVDRYLAIERARFGDRLAVNVERPSDALDCYVPSLLLQPLVENAVRHGISRRADAGRLDVTVRRIDGSVEIRVCDDGPGPSDPSNSTGLGIKNTTARLAGLYGDGHAFELRRREDGDGTEVVVRVPYHTRPLAALQK